MTLLVAPNSAKLPCWSAFAAAALLLALPVCGAAWGEKGHLLINGLAVDVAGPKLPEFISASRGHIIYNGP